MKDDLIKLGFSDHEAGVYLTLLDIGQTGAGEIIKRTGLHRNIVYDTLDRLVLKKLVFKTMVKKVTQYKIADPERIIVDQQVRLDIAKSIIPRLEQRAQVQNDIVVWDGLEGFRNFNITMLERMKEGTILYVLGSVGNRWYEMMGDSYKQYLRITTKKKIRWKMVTFEKDIEFDREAMERTGLVEMRTMKEKILAPANMLIWDDRIALQDFVEPCSTIEIQNKALADAYLNFFKAMWAQGEEYR